MIKYFIKPIVNLYLNSIPKQIKAESLTPIGVDSKGNRYYSWESLDQMPKVRSNKLQDFAIFSDMKMTVESLFELTDKIMELNEKVAVEKNKKVKTRLHAQIAALAQEMQWRTTEDTPLDIILNMAAILAVREDEKPMKFDRLIHEEKVKQFSIEDQEGNFFFLSHELFKTLHPSLVMSGDEYKKHWNNLAYQKAYQKKRSGIISQETS